MVIEILSLVVSPLRLLLESRKLYLELKERRANRQLPAGERPVALLGSERSQRSSSTPAPRPRRSRRNRRSR